MISPSATASPNEFPDQPTLLGHPTGLFTLFFAEMWERFSYYGMRALLIFYMIKGFLAYNDGEAYAVYGAYTALVYATPYIGGMLADRLIGARRAVVLGGLLMAAGHLVMTIEQEGAFFLALALLIVGNGFFKPNISTIVGGLYPKNSTKRDSGFTIFYMGINLGAAMSPLLCGYIGETYGWHYGFGLATIGMLIGLAVFVAPAGLTRVLILGGSLTAAVALVIIPDGIYMTLVNSVVAAALIAAGVLAFIAIGRGGLPKDAGSITDPSRLRLPAFNGLKANVMPYYLGIIAAVMMLQHVVPEGSHEGWIILAIGMALLTLPWVSANHAIYICTAAAVPVIALLVQRGEVAGMLLIIFGVLALGSLFAEALRANRIERHRLFVVLILMFFSMLFWSFFEQAGSSVSNFTDRNVDRVAEDRHINDDDVGKTLKVQLTQEQVGFPIAGDMFRLNDIQSARDSARDARAELAETAKAKPEAFQGQDLSVLAANGRTLIDLEVNKEHVGMGIAQAGAEVPASVFQAANPIFIMIFGLLFTGLWTFLAKRRIEPSIPVKFAFGLIQLGLGFIAFWYGADTADDRGMVWMGWLLLGYLLHTTGELCLSPVGLSMVVKLSPKRIVSTVMGAWFLATAFSNYLAGVIAALTGVEEEAEAIGDIPLPLETLDLYGDVFLKIGIAAGASALILLVLSPLLTRWMHEGEDAEESEPEVQETA